jgi:hypothetical protein
MYWIYWIALVLLVIMLILIIWLLARGSGTICDITGQLNSPCSQNNQCNSGLVCSLEPGGGVCRVAPGGVCSMSSQCGNGLTCINGVCSGPGGRLNESCPCGEGLTCTNGICKSRVLGPCLVTSDCADGRCINNVCTLVTPIMEDIFMEAMNNNLNNLACADECNNHKCRDGDCHCDKESNDSKECKYTTDSYENHHKKSQDTPHVSSDTKESKESTESKVHKKKYKHYKHPSRSKYRPTRSENSSIQRNYSSSNSSSKSSSSDSKSSCYTPISSSDLKSDCNKSEYTKTEYTKSDRYQTTDSSL